MKNLQSLFKDGVRRVSKAAGSKISPVTLAAGVATVSALDAGMSSAQQARDLRLLPERGLEFHHQLMRGLLLDRYQERALPDCEATPQGRRVDSRSYDGRGCDSRVFDSRASVPVSDDEAVDLNSDSGQGVASDFTAQASNEAAKMTPEAKEAMLQKIWTRGREDACRELDVCHAWKTPYMNREMGL